MRSSLAAEKQVLKVCPQIYQLPPPRLLEVWSQLDSELRQDPAVRGFICLLLVRFGDIAGARGLEPRFFKTHAAQEWSPRGSLWASRFMVARNRWLRPLQAVLALVIRWRSRSLCPETALISMYHLVWSNNTDGLRYMLALYCKWYGRPNCAEKQKINGFFGYICGLNSLLDDGIARLREATTFLESSAEREPVLYYWLQEQRLFLAMLYFYNRDFQLAAREHFAAQQLQQHGLFLFARIFNCATRLRLAAVEQDHQQFDEDVRVLKEFLQQGYDKRFALRVHSYRALQYAARGEHHLAMHECGIASQLSQKNPWGLEYCNHLGVKVKIFLSLGYFDQALNNAVLYAQSFGGIHDFTCFRLEAQTLLMKCLLSYRFFIPKAEQKASMVTQALQLLKVKPAPLLSGSRNWRELFNACQDGLTHSSERLLGVIGDGRTVVGDDCLHRFMQDTRFYWQQRQQRQSSGQDLDNKIDGVERSIDALAKLSSLWSRLSSPVEPLSVTAVMEGSREFLEGLFGSRLSIRYVGGEHDTQSGEELMVEEQTCEGFQLYLGWDHPSHDGSQVRVEGYCESLRFRRDIWTALKVWKALVGRILHQQDERAKHVEFVRNRAIAQTTQMVAHDVRKPFSLLTSVLEILARTGEGHAELAQRYIPQVRQSIDRVNGMLTDIMEVGGKSKLNREDVDPEQLIRAAVEENLRYESHASAAIVYRLQHRFQVRVDTIKVSRVLSNIIGNGLTAMGKQGEMWVEVEERAGMCQVTVGNSGSYIPPETAGKVFDAFYTKGNHRGTGLGLAIAKKIVTAHGGKIFCRSCPSRGTEFIFTLPLSPLRLGARLTPQSGLGHEAEISW